VTSILLGVIGLGFCQGARIDTSGAVTSYSTIITYSAWTSTSYSYWYDTRVSYVWETTTQTTDRPIQREEYGPYVSIYWRYSLAAYIEGEGAWIRFYLSLKNLMRVPIRSIVLHFEVYTWDYKTRGSVDLLVDGPILDSIEVDRKVDSPVHPYGAQPFLRSVDINLYRTEAITVMVRRSSTYTSTSTMWTLSTRTGIDLYTTTLTRIVTETGPTSFTTATMPLRSTTETETAKIDWTAILSVLVAAAFLLGIVLGMTIRKGKKT